jgi:hypothetical protein
MKILQINKFTARGPEIGSLIQQLAWPGLSGAMQKKRALENESSLKS